MDAVMAGDEEVEAVARAWWAHESPATGVPWRMVRERTKSAYRARAGEAIAALDRVRSRPARGTEGEDHEAGQTFICDRCGERLPGDVTIEHYCPSPVSGTEPECTCGSRAVIDADRHDETCWRRLWVERGTEPDTAKLVEALRDSNEFIATTTPWPGRDELFERNARVLAGFSVDAGKAKEER